MKRSSKFQMTEDSKRQILAGKLREAREYLGLSQDEVAKKVGMPRTALTNIEQGTRKVEAIELQNLATLYKRSLSYFSGEEEVSALPPDVAHLARAVSKLSSKDREELGRFAEYLKSRAAAEGKEK